MANKHIFYSFNHINNHGAASCLLLLSIFISIFSFRLSSQGSNTDCVLDIQISPPENDSNCPAGNWGGFLSNNCCTSAFDDYLLALGKHANLKGEIFLNSTGQRSCLALMEESYGDILSCGIEKLTRTEAGGCSDYSVSDVKNKFGDSIRDLERDCGQLGKDSNSDAVCSYCSETWEAIGQSLDKEGDGGKVGTDVCKFAVLLSVTSSRIDDQTWNQNINGCLGQQTLTNDEGETKRKGTETQLSPAANDEGVTKRKGTDHTSPWIWILIGGLAGISVAIAIALWIMCRKRSKEFPSMKENRYVPSDDSPSEVSGGLKISIKEIMSATNNLSALNYIGQGIAGTVYKGVLSNGLHIAVKHIVNEGHVETFVREVASLSHVRHPNLVALLGYFEIEDECFLVYELCKNGNLSEWLYGKDKFLSWNQRIEIAIDCARGLWFLHNYSEGCIVHRDIKPTNILLGDSFEAKLSDFGLSKVMDLGQSFVSSEVRGTFGYVDPEYQKNRKVNSSGDVYSFGIVLLQILSGKRVINLNMKRPMPLDKMAKFLTRGGNVAEFADPKLKGNYATEAFELILKLALSCAGHKPQRPSMEQVVQRLEKALEVSTEASFATTRSSRRMLPRN